MSRTVSPPQGRPQIIPFEPADDPAVRSPG